MLTYQTDYVILKPQEGVNYWEYYQDIEDLVIGKSKVVVTTNGKNIWVRDTYITDDEIDKIIVGFKEGSQYKFKYVLKKDLKKLIEGKSPKSFEDSAGNPCSKYGIATRDLAPYAKDCKNILKQDLPEEINVIDKPEPVTAGASTAKYSEVEDW